MKQVKYSKGLFWSWYFAGIGQLLLLSSPRPRRQRLCEGRRDRVVNVHSQWERSEQDFKVSKFIMHCDHHQHHEESTFTSDTISIESQTNQNMFVSLKQVVSGVGGFLQQMWRQFVTAAICQSKCSDCDLSAGFTVKKACASLTQSQWERLSVVRWVKKVPRGSHLIPMRAC